MPQLLSAKAVRRLVGRRIRSLREDRTPKELTQRELAERTRGALSRSSIANIERGRQGISLEQLFILAHALGVKPADLLPSPEEVLSAESDSLARLKKPLAKADRAWIDRVRQNTGGEDA